MYLQDCYERELDNEYIASLLDKTVDEMFELCEEFNCEPRELIDVLETKAILGE